MTEPLYKKHFYHSLLRKYVIAFGTLFKQIEIIRSNQDGSENHREMVPLAYANREKFLRRLEQDFEIERTTSIKMPRMAFTINNIAYAPERKISSKRKINRQIDAEPNVKYNIFNPLPYDIFFGLTIVAKTQDEMLQIIEQIIPFFTPDYTIAIHGLASPHEVTYDIPVNLLSTNYEDTYDGSFDEARRITWDLEFNMKAYMFGPVRKQGIIKTAITNVNDSDDQSIKYFDSTIYPVIDGVPLNDILESDNYAINIDVNEYFNG